MTKTRIFNNVSVQNKILMILGVASLGLILVWGANFVGQRINADYQQEVERTNKLRSIVSDVRIGFLQERRNEKDFLIRLLPKYVDRHAKVAEEVDTLLIGALEQAIGDEITQINTTKSDFDEYVIQFVAVAKMWQSIGLTQDEGLRGNLRTAVKNVEKIVKKYNADAVMVSMLMLRRAEKDFIIRVDDKYQEKHKNEMNNFITLINASSIPAEDKGKIKDLAAEYAKSFNELVSLRIKATSEVKVLSNKYAKAEPILIALYQAVDKKGIAADDAQHSVQAQVQTIGLGVVLVIFLAVLGLAIVIGRSIAVPVGQLNDEMKRISDGEDVDIAQRSGTDEIAMMGNTLSIFQSNMIEANRLQKEAAEQQNIELERGRKIDSLAQDFDNKIGHVLQIVSSATTELNASAHTMSSIATGSSDRATAAAAASEEASTNVQTVSAACEELSASIQEISRQAVQSNELAQQATEDVTKTENVVQELSESANRINEVVSIISDIAEQTNLLALNATIEAARAGEAGKGFAVVASEVKSLANQTGRATSEIGETIAVVLNKVTESVNSINSVTGRISDIAQMIATIASAVEEQNAATSEISRNVEEASKGTADVNKNVGEVSTMADEAGAASGEVQKASDELATQSNKMKNVVDEFLDDVKAV